MRILGVIPARAGSKGVPHKNLRLVAERPLLGYVLDAARAASRLDRLVVSTDSEAIAAVARDHGVDAPFTRPADLAQDQVSLIPVIQHAMAWHDAMGWRPDVVVSLQPTSPLLESADIDRAIRLLERTACDSVVAVTEILHHHPFRAMALDGDRLSPLTEHTSERYLQKQDRPPAYGFTGGLYVRRRYLLEQWTGRDFALGADVRGLVIEPERALNIDTEMDLLVLEAILRQRAAKTCEVRGKGFVLPLTPDR